MNLTLMWNLTYKNWIFSEHIQSQLSKRKIDRNLVEMTIDNPDEVIPAEQDRLIYQKVINNRLVRVVTEDNTLVTVYVTSKIRKYMKGKQL
jgi:hypothetical protein